MKIIGGLLKYDKFYSLLNIPPCIRSPIGLEKGTSVYFASLSVFGNDNKGVHIIISPIKINTWNTLYKIYVKFLVDREGLVNDLVNFLEKELKINILFVESITTKLGKTHEVTLIADISRKKVAEYYKDNIKQNQRLNLKKKVESAIKWYHLTKVDNKVDTVPEVTQLEFLKKTWDNQNRDLRNGLNLEDYHEIISEKGGVTIPRCLVDNIDCEKGIIYCDTEEKYICITLLDKSKHEPYWLDVIHIEKEREISIITNVLKGFKCNILSSYNRLERMSRIAHFNVIIDIKKLPKNDKYKDDRLPNIIKELKDQETVLDVLLKHYNPETEEIITKTVEMGLVYSHTNNSF